MNNDIRNLTKWLNEGQEAPIDRQALARVLAMAQQPAPATELRGPEPVAWCSQCGHKCPQPAPIQQEPVGWWDDKLGFFAEKHFDQLQPIYKSPAQRTWVHATEWRGLTDEDIKEAEWLLSAIKEHEAYTLQEQLLVEGVDVFARAIEAKLREKNGIKGDA